MMFCIMIVAFKKKTITVLESLFINSGLLGAGFQMFGSEEKLNANPLQHLFEVSKAIKM